VHPTPIDKAQLLNTRRNGTKLFSKILCIANPIFTEIRLPDQRAKIGAHLVRKIALDAIGATLNGPIRKWSQQDMQMFRQYAESMKSIVPVIPIVKKHLDQQLSVPRLREECGTKVSA
jgi:hypothetical protein